MEEFKNLKEIIELCEEELDKNDENVHATLDFEDLKELQNLINKYEELQKESFEDYKSYFDLVQEDNELLVQKEKKIKELEKERDGIYADYQDLGKEKLKLEEENQAVRGANNYWVMKFCEANNKNKEQEKLIEIYDEKLMFALSPTTHELAQDTKINFKKIIRENINDDTYTIKKVLKDYWNKKAKGE